MCGMELETGGGQLMLGPIQVVGNLRFIHECITLFADEVGAPTGRRISLGGKTVIP